MADFFEKPSFEREREWEKHTHTLTVEYHYSKYKFIRNKRLSFHSICHLKQRWCLFLQYASNVSLSLSACAHQYSHPLPYHPVAQQIGHRFDFHINNFLGNDVCCASHCVVCCVIGWWTPAIVFVIYVLFIMEWLMNKKVKGFFIPVFYFDNVIPFVITCDTKMKCPSTSCIE